MKLKQTVLAAAMALAAPAVFAVAPTSPTDTAGAVVVFMSGATAPDEFMESIATGMFKPGFYKYKAKVGGTSTSRAFLGEVSNDASIPASIRNQKVLFIKRSTGGSVWGVNPVARAQGVAVMNAANVYSSAAGKTCDTAAGTDGYYACPVIGDDITPNGDEKAPDFGVSDVAPFMFKEPFNVEFGKTQLSTTETAGLTVRSVNTLMMGVVATAAVPDSTFISEADYGAMLTGNLTDWSQIGDGSTAPAGGNQVVVCRRVPGSGTQTSYNWYFNNFPCSTGSAVSGVSGETTPARMDASTFTGVGTGTSVDPFQIDVTAGYTVIENSGSGDVRRCLNAAQHNLDYTFKGEDGLYYNANFSAAPGPLGAIGVLSLDSQQSTGVASAYGTDGKVSDKGAETAWFFRTLNGAGKMAKNTNNVADETCSSTGTLSGVCPNRDALRDGQYLFASELTMQYLTGLSGQKRAFADEFIDRAGDPSYQKPWTLALPPVYDPTVSTVVAKGTRNGNMCAPLQKLF